MGKLIRLELFSMSEDLMAKNLRSYFARFQIIQGPSRLTVGGFIFYLNHRPQWLRKVKFVRGQSAGRSERN